MVHIFDITYQILTIWAPLLLTLKAISAVDYYYDLIHTNSKDIRKIKRYRKEAVGSDEYLRSLEKAIDQHLHACSLTYQTSMKALRLQQYWLVYWLCIALLHSGIYNSIVELLKSFGVDGTGFEKVWYPYLGKTLKNLVPLSLFLLIYENPCEKLKEPSERGLWLYWSIPTFLSTFYRTNLTPSISYFVRTIHSCDVSPQSVDSFLGTILRKMCISQNKFINRERVLNEIKCFLYLESEVAEIRLPTDDENNKIHDEAHSIREYEIIEGEEASTDGSEYSSKRASIDEPSATPSFGTSRSLRSQQSTSSLLDGDRIASTTSSRTKKVLCGIEELFTKSLSKSKRKE